MASDVLVNGKRSRCDHPWRHKLPFKFFNRGWLPASREVVLLGPRMDLQWPSISLQCKNEDEAHLVYISEP
jgi:hypothetical protein